MPYSLLKIADVNNRGFDHCFIKKTNIRQTPSRYTNENKQQTSTKEIYIENDFQT